MEELRRLLGGPGPDPQRVLTVLRERRLLGERRSVDDRALQRAIVTTLKATEGGGERRRVAETIALDDLLRHAETVANLRGRLRTTFDGVALPVTSRNGLYLVLAAVAVQTGRQDAIPSDDLIVPPARVPPGIRARPLGPSGWYLLLNRDKRPLAAAVATLIEALALHGRLEARQGDQPYPDGVLAEPEE